MFNLGTDSEGKLVVEELSLDTLVPFEGHPFYTYEGERLEDMVESIKTNGVIVPILTRKKPEGRRKHRPTKRAAATSTGTGKTSRRIPNAETRR